MLRRTLSEKPEIRNAMLLKHCGAGPAPRLAGRLEGGAGPVRSRFGWGSLRRGEAAASGCSSLLRHHSLLLTWQAGDDAAAISCASLPQPMLQPCTSMRIARVILYKDCRCRQAAKQTHMGEMASALSFRFRPGRLGDTIYPCNMHCVRCLVTPTGWQHESMLDSVLVQSLEAPRSLHSPLAGTCCSH